MNDFSFSFTSVPQLQIEIFPLVPNENEPQYTALFKFFILFYYNLMMDLLDIPRQISQMLQKTIAGATTLHVKFSFSKTT